MAGQAERRVQAPARRRARVALAALLAATLAGCGTPPPDPGATRSDAQSKELRDRMPVTQGRS